MGVLSCSGFSVCLRGWQPVASGIVRLQQRLEYQPLA